MSLIVWLPLNGDLENQGLSNVTVTNNGATVDDNGKTGKCYKCSGDSRISFPSFNWMTMKPQNNFSFFFWAKGTTNGWLFACSAWEFRLCPGYIQIHLAGNGQYPARYTSTFDTNTWYHLGFTWSGSDGKLLLYLNGSKVAESNVPSSANYDIASTFNLPYDGPRYLNDVRVYDHCLSAKEVKELAKGLVLHYKLAGPGQPNLAKNTFGTEENGYTVPSSGGSEGGPRYAVSGIEGGKTYTVSAYIKGSANMNLYTINSGGNVAYPWVDKSSMSTDYKFYSLTFTMATGRGTTNEIYICTRWTTTPTPGDWFKILPNSVKIEEGSVATPWCPNPADALYSAMGYNNNIEYDCSGFGNNGTKSGAEMIWDINSPRYTTSYKFIGSGQKISVAKKIVPQLTDATFSVWFYRSDYGPQTHESLITILDDPINNVHNYFEIETKYSSTNDTRIWVYNGANAPVSKTNAYELNKWTHVAVTLNSTQIKLYINGELVSTGTSHTLPDKANYWIGSYNGSQSFKGNISDVRIYATELSAEDIAELYHSAVIVDNTGKSYAYEYFEA